MVIWTVRALRHLREIENVLGERSPAAATRTVQRLYDRGRQIDAFPASGRVVPEWEIPGVRELIQHPYRIIYRLMGNGDVEILAVLHGARSLEP